MVVVMMGVSGCGKSTIGTRLAALLGAEFVEGDEYHPKANVEKMRAGIPLDDDDRRPWLETLSRKIAAWLDEGRDGVLACSALKQAYRDILGAGRAGVHFVYLKGEEQLIRARLELRRGHYMPPSLLTSQIRTLEEPKHAIVAEITGEPDEIAREVAAALRASTVPPHRSPGS